MKKLWNQNRVLFMLFVILIVCFVAIVIVSLTFFYSKNVSNYGARLDDIAKYPITEKDKENFKEAVLEGNNVTKVTINIIGRIIYVHITFDEQIDLENAKSFVTKSLDLFSEDILSYYDVEFALKSDNFTIFGAKNSVIDYISWNNNREVEEEEEVNED